MAFGHEDAAIGGYQDVVGLPEVLGFPAPARLAKAEEEGAVGAELEDLVALTGGVALLGRAGAGAVGHPDVALAIHEDPVGREQRTGAEALHHGASRIEFEDGVEIGAGAAIGATPLGHPDADPVLVYFHGAGGAPGPAFGHPGPAGNGPVRVGQVVGGGGGGRALGKDGGDGGDSEDSED